jgi:putative endonuclease
VPRTLSGPQPPPYWLYLLECEDGAYYAGIALDVEQRFFRHVFGLGAKFTRARPPVRVLAAREYANKGEALRAELQLKALRRGEKLAFFGIMAREEPHERIGNSKKTEQRPVRRPYVGSLE